MINNLKIAPGTLVSYIGENYLIKKVVDLSRVILKKEGSHTTLLTVDIKELATPIDAAKQIARSKDLSTISDEQWEIARARLSVIEPMLKNKLSLDEVKSIASANNIHPSTLYRWKERYDLTGKLSSLIPYDKTGGRGKSRLEEDIEEIMASTIERIYLNTSRKSIKRTIEEVERVCKEAGIVSPSSSTIRKRIAAISDEQKLKRRYGKSVSKQHYEPIKGSVPGADYPLSLVQIDHTKLDVILVDEVYRKPIDRPWITIAIDVFSRMVLGFYVSFDPPGATGTGMCLSNAILPKESLLASLDIEGEWPCWGVMKTLHMDNAKEFRGNMIRRAAEEYGIDIVWRPVKEPQYGGHIEKYMDTLKEEIHNLPGTTFSNVQHRAKFPSEKRAAMTLKELEVWLTAYIVKVYHQRYHKSIKMAPINKFREGILGNGVKSGIGLPLRMMNERKVRLDFLPALERSVQEYGVQIDHIQYYSDVLRQWINAVEPGSTKHRVKRKFLFKRDPRDISVIYFFDPELREYFDIPYRNLYHPAITIWEYRSVERWLRQKGKEAIDEEQIFEGLKQMRTIEEKSKQKTTHVKRSKAAIKAHHSRERSIQSILPKKKDNQLEEQELEATTITELKSFEDIDYAPFT